MVEQIITAGRCAVAACTTPSAPKPVPVKAGAQFVVSVTTDPSGHYVVTPDDLRRPLDRGSLRADGAVFGSLGKFPRTRRPDNFFRDVVFVPDP